MLSSENSVAPNRVGSTGGSALERIRALQAKAAMKQAAVDACQGHIWGKIYVSKIDHSKGSSAACIRCGERRAWTDIGPNEQWEHDTSLPNVKDEPRR